MKIAVISFYLPTGLQGGVPVQVHLLANEMARRGHAVTVFSFFQKPPGALYEVKTVGLPTAWQARVRKRHGWGMYVFPWFVAREDFSPFDLVWAHGDSHAIRTTAPLVRTFHSSGLDQALRPRSWRQCAGMMGIYPWEWLSGRRSRRCVFVSHALRKYFPLLKGIVIPDAVDLSVFRPQPDARSASPTILFVAGTALGRKRGALLYRQFREKVLPKIPNAFLWMVCAEKFEGPNVVWRGLRSNERLVPLYQACWVFCLPSSHETFGVPYIEAMACGAPVVATPNGGAREVLGNGRFGALTSPAQLGETLVEALGDSKRREQMAVKGLERAREFSLTRVADRYEALFKEIQKSRV